MWRRRCVCVVKGEKEKKREAQKTHQIHWRLLVPDRISYVVSLLVSLGPLPSADFFFYFVILPNWTFYVSFLAASLRCFNLRSGGIIYVSTSIPPPLHPIRLRMPLYDGRFAYTCVMSLTPVPAAHTRTHRFPLFFPLFCISLVLQVATATTAATHFLLLVNIWHVRWRGGGGWGNV